MAVFIIFVSIVVISLVLQWQTKRWLISTGVPCGLFAILVLSGALFPKHVFPAFMIGMPMIFFASLLGSYLYETRFNPDRHQQTVDENADATSSTTETKGQENTEKSDEFEP